MLGHRLYLDLKRDHDVAVTVRADGESCAQNGVFDPADVFSGVDAVETDRLIEVVASFQPNAIVNAVGVIKQREDAKESILNIEVNALLPHRLALVAKAAGARLIHFSTDCVFSGRQGMYSETDTPDANDLYGRTKLLGEVDERHALTLRSSLIGHELERKASLLEWFLGQQKGSVRGFNNAIFSGFTTIEMARIVKMLLERHPDAHGVWHVSSEPIDKCRLLRTIKRVYGVETEIIPDDELKIDRSLDSTRFRRCFNYRPPSWDSMVAEMHEVYESQSENR